MLYNFYFQGDMWMQFADIQNNDFMWQQFNMRLFETFMLAYDIEF